VGSHACYAAAWSDDLSNWARLQRTIINQPLVLDRKADGSPVALDDRCCHRLAPLSKARLENEDLRCVYHGPTFWRTPRPGRKRSRGTIRLRQSRFNPREHSNG
jgi:vanillate O-demethylase monooxygenase subunit